MAGADTYGGRTAITTAREPKADRAYPPISLATRLVILAGGPSISLATSLIQPILPAIQADLASGPEDAFLVKMLIGVMGIAMVIGAAITGFLVDRFGLKRVMSANYALYAVAGTAGLYLADLPLLLVSRFLLGMAASGAVTGSIIIINSLLPQESRATWLGYYNGVAQISSVVFNPLSGLLGEMNWHWSFAIYGIAAPFAVLAMTALQGRVPMRPEEAMAGPEPLLRWFPLRFAVIGIALGVIIYIPAVYLPFLLNGLGMKSPQSISLVLTGDIIAGSIAALCFGRARRSLSELGAFRVAVAMAGFGLTIAGFATNYVSVIVGSIFFGVGVAWFLPTLMLGTATRVEPGRQGRAAGLVKSANYMGSPIAVFLAEPVARSYGASGAILAAAGLSLTLLVASITGKVFGPSDPRKPAPMKA